MNDENLLFRAVWMNWGIKCYPRDEIEKKEWLIFNNKTVSANAWYTKSGKISVGNIALIQEDFNELKKLFEKDFLDACAYKDAYDGEGWEMTLFERNGNIIHQISGYIYGVEPLEKIAAALSKFPLYFRFFGPGGSY